MKQVVETYFISMIKKKGIFDKIKPDKTKIKQWKKYLVDTLMGLIIDDLLKKKTALTPGAKRVELLCPNAFKSGKSETKLILQKFADRNDGSPEMVYYKKFPAHRQEAIDYFHVKYNSISIATNSIK